MNEKRINYLNNNVNINEEMDKLLLTVNMLEQNEDNITDDIKKKFQDNSIIYLNSTEVSPLHELISPTDNLLTVLSSGDYLLDASFHGAGKVTTFDINKLQYFIAQLKLIALQRLSYKDYCDFFSGYYKDEYLSKKIYNRIKDDIDEEDLSIFWNRLLDRIEIDRVEMNKELDKLNLSRDRDILNVQLLDYGLIFSDKLNERTINNVLSLIDSEYDYNTFFYNIMGLGYIRDENFYLNSMGNYKKTKRKVHNTDMDFINTDIKYIKDNLEKNGCFDSFNSIYLSNVPEYINSKEFLDIFDKQLMPLLDKDGVLAFCCQGMGYDTITMNNKKLEEIKNQVSGNKLDLDEIVRMQKVINIVESFNELRKKYKIETSRMNTEYLRTGYSVDDTYVYVKKK